MEKTLLWDVFIALEKAELRELHKFIRSPFFNTRQHLIGLFDYLSACREQQRTPDKDGAFAAAWPEASRFEDTRMRLANSDLLALIEHFWVYQEKFADYNRGKIRLAGIYRRRNLPKHFMITLREAQQDRQSRAWRQAEYFHDLYLIEWERFQAASAEKRYETFNLQETSDLLDLNYIARKLRHACIAQSHSAVVGKTYEFGLLDAILTHVREKKLLTYPAIALYYYALHFLSDPSAEDHFQSFRQVLTGAADQFPTEELRALYLLALNFGIKKSNETGGKDLRWYRQTFELYREALQLKLLLENGNLSRFAYNNIVGVAIRLGEVDWAEQFVHEYKPELERKFREAAFSLNLARIAYERHDYARALPLLQLADYKDLISSMNAKILALKIYFENEEWDLLDSHLHSTRNYLRRQRASGYHLENYNAILRFARLLMRYKMGDDIDANALRLQIQQAPTLSEREWMLKMTNDE